LTRELTNPATTTPAPQETTRQDEHAFHRHHLHEVHLLAPGYSTEGTWPDHLEPTTQPSTKGDPATTTKKIKNRDQRTEADGEM
jgi:hypothetical protein